MPIVLVPQRSSAPGPWLALRRFFRLEGRLAGVRYQARVGIYELTPPEPAPQGREVGRTEPEAEQG